MRKPSSNDSCRDNFFMSINLKDLTKMIKWETEKTKMLNRKEVAYNYSPEMVKNERIRMNLTQQKLADMMGIQVQKLARWEKGTPISPEGARLLSVISDSFDSK